MGKSFVFLIMAFLLLSTAKTRPLSTSIGQQADNSQTPFSPESSLVDDECKGLDGEECLVQRSLAAHTDYIYTQQNIVP
ncbi:Phytosulfokines 1 [Hibiscus syriacus]|uniref:Phytosulfokine n=1 Tax=Hibiscus syriacus TaxID=106335 RepID=A0A6A3CR61_HIBSY|nr:phytosulfokines 3-like [Hibiscus syriacus]KAE8730032.1 Phytosulfokines 1 [Hibiscus syriacus]